MDGPKVRRQLCTIVGICGCATLAAFGFEPEKQKSFGLDVPFDALVFFECVEGSAGAKTEFGIGTSKETFKPVLSGLPRPTDKKKVGKFKKGERIEFAMKTKWAGQEHWAFTTKRDRASMVAFADKNGKSALMKVKPGVWKMKLDDAASHLVDNAENDMVIVIYLARLN